VQSLQHALRIASVKQHLAALRHWMDWLTERGVLRVNPAAAVRGPRHAVQEGKTPVLERDQARRLLEVLDGDDLRTLRDRALIAVMLFGFVRVGAVVKMRVRDFDDAGAHARRCTTRCKPAKLGQTAAASATRLKAIRSSGYRTMKLLGANGRWFFAGMTKPSWPRTTNSGTRSGGTGTYPFAGAHPPPRRAQASARPARCRATRCAGGLPACGSRRCSARGA
jgi:integrase